MNIIFLSIKVRFEIHKQIYSFVWDAGGFEIVRLDGNYDRPHVLQVMYAGDDIGEAARVVRGLV